MLKFYLGLSLMIASLCGAFVFIYIAPVSAQASIPADDSKAVILAYLRINEDAHPDSTLSLQNFKDQIDILRNEEFHVMSLNDIIDAWNSNTALPPKAIAITFDGAYQSINDGALSYLLDHNIPFTIFIPSDQMQLHNHLDWKTIKTLARNDLVSFGIAPASYMHITNLPEAEQENSINRSRIALKKQIGQESEFFAYPFGEVTQNLYNIVEKQGFKAAFGMQSGAAYNGYDRLFLPRFTITEAYADLDRFRMLINSYPLPVQGFNQNEMELREPITAINLALTDFTKKQINKISCFITDQEKPVFLISEKNLTIIPESPIIDDRTRLNCTIPYTNDGSDEVSWRWFGALFHRP